jgi:hypothetical protein
LEKVLFPDDKKKIVLAYIKILCFEKLLSIFKTKAGSECNITERHTKPQALVILKSVAIKGEGTQRAREMFFLATKVLASTWVSKKQDVRALAKFI